MEAHFINEHSCRLCLRRLGLRERVSIFEADSTCRPTLSIPLKIMTCVSIDVQAKEPFPRFICTDCRMQLDDFYLFKQVCLAADLQLKEHYERTPWLRRRKQNKIGNDPVPHEHVPSQSPSPFVPTDVCSSTVIKTEPYSEEECGPIVAMELDALSNNIDDEEVGTSISQPSVITEYKPIKILKTFSVTSDSQMINEIEIKVEPLDVLIPDGGEYDPSDCISTTSTLTAKESLSLNSPSTPTRMDLTYNEPLNEDTPLAHYMDRHIIEVDDGSFIYDANDEQALDNMAMNTDGTKECQYNKCNKFRKNYQCNKCAESFRRLSDLRVHKDTHLPTELKPFVCSVCPEKFSNKRFSEEHEQTHARATIFHCKECTVSCRTLPELKGHVKSHKCLLECICGQRFATQTEYREHEKTHIAKKQKCTRASLKGEYKIESQNTVNTNYQPPAINYQTHQQSSCVLNLQDQQRTVYPEDVATMTFKCKVCAIAFKTEETLIWHEAQHRNDMALNFKKYYDIPPQNIELTPSQTQSNEPQPFQCIPCKVGFPHKGALICHQAFYHRHAMNQNIVQPEAFTCQVCHLVFLNKNKYIIHKESHKYDRPIEEKQSVIYYT